MTLVLRQVKGSELTFAELDGNFEHCLDRANHTGSYTQVDKLGFDTAAAQTAGVGEMVWNAADGTADLGLPGG